MKNRKPLLITIVLLIIVSLVILVVIALTSYTAKTPEPTPIVSFPGGVTEPEDEEAIPYAYAVITDNDNIKLKTTLGAELLINIDTKNWKGIKWSLKGSYVVVLGETQKDIYNLYLYDIKNKDWVQITNFDKAGVTSFEWIDNDTILFTQGGWLHRYKYSTLNEIVKIYQVDALLVSMSPNRSTLVLQDVNNTFYVLSIEGKLLFTLDKIANENNTEFITITKVYYSKDSETLLIITTDNKLYKWDLGNTNANEIVIQDSEIDLTSLNIVCSLEVDKFKAFTLSDTLIVDFYSLDIANNMVDLISSKTSELPISNLDFNCSDDNGRFVFNLIDETGNNWYVLQEPKTIKLVILDEAKFLDVRTLSN